MVVVQWKFHRQFELKYKNNNMLTTVLRILTCLVTTVLITDTPSYHCSDYVSIEWNKGN